MAKPLIITKQKEIYKEIANELDTTVETVDDVVTSTWMAVAKFMAEDRENAIYLRHLGTFYGKKEIIYYMEKNKLKTDEKSSGEL